MTLENRRGQVRAAMVRFRETPGVRERERKYSEQYHRDHPEKVRVRVERWRLSQGPQLVVYAWVSPEGYVDYVGRGGRKRPYYHRRKPWWTPQHMLLTMTCKDEWQAMEYEGRWGGRYRPAQNVDGARR